MTKVFTEDNALELAEKLLQNDKNIKDEFEQKEYVTETFVTNAIANAQLSGGDVDLSGYASKEDLDNYAIKEHSHDEYLIEHQDLSQYALKSQIPNLDGYAKTEDIPTTLPASDVYDWAKAETKPTYSADEVGALPNTTNIPSIDGLVSEEQLAETLSPYAKIADIVEYDDTELVNDIASVEAAIASEKSERQEAISLLSSDVAYISDETTDVGEIGTVLNTQHIVDNLDSSLSTMVLSAKQGKVLNERINTFTTLAEGSTTGDAELADIRVDTSGTTHASAGDAVRNQINQLNSEIAEMQDIIYYKELDMGEILVDTWISSTGSVASHAGNNLTDFIPVEVGQKIFIDGTVTRLCYYNTNKTSLASALGTPTSLVSPIIEVPSNSESNQPKYIRFCYKVEGNENITCYLVDDVVMNGKNFVFPEKSIDWSALKDVPIEKKCNIASYWGSGSYPSLSIFLKKANSDNSIRLRLCHYTSDSENGYDLWQMRGAQPIIDGVEQSTIIANGSAWECAIKESGKADFVGCYPHGNQYADSIKVVVDGLETDITAINNMPFHTLDFYMIATLYSYGTNKGTELGKHYIHYTFADGCVEIEQKVIFSTNATLGLSYMAMLPSAKEYSEQQNIDGKWFLTATETSPRASGGMVGETLHNGIKSRMEVLSDNSDGFDEHIYSETDKSEYNKIYKTFYKNGKEVHNNSVMKSKTRYTFTF